MTLRKKILVITYYWPPAGGPGVQRWLKFVKYLPEFGWEPTVFIPQNASYPIVDDTLSGEISADLKILRQPIWEPYHLAELFGKSNKKFKAGQFDVAENQSWKSKLSIWVRGNFFIPDARIFWVKPSVRRLKKYLEENNFDAIATTGPPHSVHLIGLALKKHFPDLPWVADFRDPWTEISYYQHLKLTQSADRKHRALEQEVFKTANVTLATSYADAENFSAQGAHAVCITNGFDLNTSQIQNRAAFRSDQFTLSYIGVLEQLRNPVILWQQLEQILHENKDFKKHFVLKFVGRIDDQILAKLQSDNLGDHIENKGYLSHGEANQEMKTSELLLITNFADERSKGIIPGKIFEYLAAGKEILSFGPAGSDVQKIMEETNAGKHFTHSADAETLKRYLLERFELWKNGSTEIQKRDIQQFSRRNLTASLAELLNSLLAENKQ